jgi:hypothetical protein
MEKAFEIGKASATGIFPQFKEPSGGYLREDSIVSILRWFRYDPKRIIGKWNCGNFTVIDYGRLW